MIKLKEMNGLHSRIIQLYETQVLPKLSAQELFDDGMYLFELQLPEENIFEAHLLFQLAAEKGHSDAAWIWPILRDSEDLQIGLVMSERKEAAHLLYLLTKQGGDEALASNWHVAHSHFFGQLASWQPMYRLWVWKHANRNARGLLNSQFPGIAHLSDIQQLLDERDPWVQWKFAKNGDWTTYSLAFSSERFHLDQSRAFKWWAGKCMAEMRAGTHGIPATHIQYRVGKAMIQAGHGIANLKLHNDFANAFMLYDETCVRRSSAIYTTILVCRQYGCNRDLQRLMARLVWTMFDEMEWIRELTVEQNQKRQKR